MNERILIVDNDEDQRTLLCEGLRRRGLDVETVDSALACLMRIDEVVFDVVITDVKMPGMSGVELCQLLSQRMPPLVTIIVTSLRDLAAMPSVLASGAFEVLAKPLQLSAIVAAVRRATPRPTVPLSWRRRNRPYLS